MRTLLVCTDFSTQAYQAARFAAVLAQQYQVPSITLFHAYRGDPAANSLLQDEERAFPLERGVLSQLQMLKKNLQTSVPHTTEILLRAEKMPLAENINELCEEENADMVVIGLSQKTGLDPGLPGENIAGILRQSQCSVFVVPSNATLTPISKILFA